MLYADMPVVPVRESEILSREAFGPEGRFELVEFATRFGWTEWQVTDSAVITRCGLPDIVVQGLDRSVAVSKAMARL